MSATKVALDVAASPLRPSRAPLEATPTTAAVRRLRCKAACRKASRIGSGIGVVAVLEEGDMADKEKNEPMWKRA